LPLFFPPTWRSFRAYQHELLCHRRALP
jgi:hypothetical protein